ncbi:MAG: FlgD immunoglobulin-like domain containing protein [Calditrichia bacterium]
MKALICLLNIIIILCYSFVLHAQNYINFQYEDLHWVSQTEWAIDIFANLYIDGEPVEDPGIYYYYWETNRDEAGHQNMCKKGGFYLWINGQGYGIIKLHPDGHGDEFYQARLTVKESENGPVIAGPSETACFGRGGSAQQVHLWLHRANDEIPSGEHFIKKYVEPFYAKNADPSWVDILAGPSTFAFLTLSEDEHLEYLWTNDDFMVPNYTEKFHHWNENPPSIFENYHGFQILQTTNDLDSYLDDIYSATIRTDLISGGAIKFKDPWLPDGTEKAEIPKNRGMDGALWYPYNTSLVIQPNESDFYRGVFKNQGLPNWTPPYYRVRVENPQYINFHGESTAWYFQGWRGSNVQFQYPNQIETGVAFTDDDAEARAVYKGHLVSNTTNATASNNQRKMVYDATTGKYHLVYEDNGEIYYTYTTGTDTWAPEYRLSDGNGDNETPSIADDGSGHLLVVWQKTDKIMARYRYYGWSSIMTVFDMETETFGSSTPVVVWFGLDSHFHIIWRNFGSKGNNLMIGRFLSTYGIYPHVDVANTNSNSCHPTLSASSIKMHLAWEESGQTYYSKIIYSNGTYIFVSKENVSAGSGCTSNTYPSITVDGSGRPNVAWQAFDPSYPGDIIVHARGSASGLPSWTYNILLFDLDNYKPSITGFPGISENTDLRLLWYWESYNAVIGAKYNGSYWSFLSGIQTSASDVSLSANRGSQGKAKMVYRKYTSSPYLLKTTSSELDLSLGKIAASSGESTIHHRRGVISGDGNAISLELGEIFIDENPIKLLEYPDTLAVVKDKKWEELLRSEIFTVKSSKAGSAAKIQYLRQFSVSNRESWQNILSNEDEIKLELNIVDAATGKTLKTLEKWIVSQDIPENSGKVMQYDIETPQNHEVFLQVTAKLPAGKDFQQAMIQVYEKSKDNSFQRQPAEESIAVSLVPKEYMLHPAYPNPFNPSTTISFDLPEEANIILEVYDLTGRRIRSLTNGYYQAGNHQVVWDGTNDRGNPVASGIYIYRLLAGEYVQSRKMMLMK